MKILLSMALAAFAATESGAQDAARAIDAQATIGDLAHSAEQRLAESVAELAKLRDEIAAEKLPLSQELGTLEQQVAERRRDHERIARSVEEGNLEIARIKAEIKGRQDELAYVGNLLDEYARGIESKVNVSELQHLGEAIATAKQASEDPNVPMRERFSRQLVFVQLTINRLIDVIGGARFPGVGVDLQGMVANGQFAVIGPVALFSTASGVAGLVVPQTGSDKPLIRPLEEPMQAGLASLVDLGEGLLPFDPSRGGALKALVQKTNLIHIFEKGGPIMWPLLLASVLALGAVIERLVFLVNERRKRDRKALERLFADVERGHVDNAIRQGRTSKDFVVRTLVYALEHKEQSLPSALLYAQAQELKRFRRGIPILDTVITLAPLLGLLGTVTGMMGSFSLIGGDLGAPGAITGGIAEALIATAFGLGIAITALLPFNFLNAKLEDAQHEIDAASTQLELLMHPAVIQAAPPMSTPSTVQGGIPRALVAQE